MNLLHEAALMESYHESIPMSEHYVPLLQLALRLLDEAKEVLDDPAVVDAKQRFDSIST